MNMTRVVVVTGGGAGIGKACALRFAAEGYAVAILDACREDSELVRNNLEQSGAEVEICVGDVAEEASSRRVAERALERWGRIDVLVANAGARVYGGLLEANEADWDRIVSVNLKGVAYSARAVLPAMIRQNSGALVFISSANALVGRADMPLYDATKAAVISLARSLAVAHGRNGIRVNSVCPGFTVTDFHERAARDRGLPAQELRAKSAGYGLLGRPAEPSETAAAVYFLASNEAVMITGQTLFVDSGMSVTSRAP
jgi:NAD(P)-dependent dehydrogenase (short-subunit alcohol dehydrogenase family)